MPLKDQPSTSKAGPIRSSKRKSKGKAAERLDDHSPDNETNVSSDKINEAPSRSEFQKLSNTVNELADLIKSLKKDVVSSNQNTSVQNATSFDSSSNNIASETNNEEMVEVASPHVDNIEMGNTLPRDLSNQNDTPLDLNNIGETISSHLSNLMGHDELFPKPGNYVPNDQPVDMKVSDKIRNMIWTNQYIDIGVLLDPSLEFNSKPKYELFGQAGESLSLAPKKQSRYITGLGQWCSAFTVFITIYCQKFPAELPSLFTYMNTIKKLSHRNGAYLTYDEEFRYMRQTQQLPWNITHSGLWLECRDSANQQKSQKSNKNKNNNGFRNNNVESSVRKQTHPTGFCFRYHSFGKCGRPNCGFKHFCYMQACNNDQHPFIRCPNNGKFRDQLPVNTTAKPNSAPTPKSK